MKRNIRSVSDRRKDETIRQMLVQMGLEETDDKYWILYDALWRSTTVEVRRIH